jgi:hypothetical protein
MKTIEPVPLTRWLGIMILATLSATADFILFFMLAYVVDWITFP